MREKAIQFGLRKSLVGILALPEACTSRCGVIFLNSGILHSVGASRLHVLSARDLAAVGVPTLRFDQSTIGDSGPRYASGSYLAAAAAEASDAIELLKRKSGVESVILFGLCSGSDVGFEVASERNDVVGLIQLDPYAYRTPGYYLKHYLPRMTRASIWLNFIRRLPAIAHHTMFHRCPASAENQASEKNSWFERPEYVRTFPERSKVARKYSELVKRGVRFLCVFSGGQVYAYNYEGQLRDCLPSCDFGDSLTEKFYPGSTHIFTNIADQLSLRKLIVSWMHEYSLPQAAPLSSAEFVEPAQEQSRL